MNTTQNLLNSFLIVYFYKIENELNTTKNGLETIKFQSEEANTDEHLKKYFQDFLLKHNDLSDVKLKKLAVKIDSEEHTIDIANLQSYKITNVLLPEQLQH
jgi:hypothetical protein